jgi:hypothetical protein
VKTKNENCHIRSSTSPPHDKSYDKERRGSFPKGFLAALSFSIQPYNKRLLVDGWARLKNPKAGIDPAFKSVGGGFRLSDYCPHPSNHTPSAQDFIRSGMVVNKNFLAKYGKPHCWSIAESGVCT